jgi:hypothetical protein
LLSLGLIIPSFGPMCVFLRKKYCEVQKVVV